MNKLIVLLTVAVLMVARNSSATIIATDNASDAVYSPAWTTGDNGGSGFNAWTLRTSSGGQDGFNGQFIGTSANNGNGTTTPNIDTTGSKAFGEYGNSGNNAVGFRGFGVSLALNSTFSWSMDNGNIDNGNAVGLVLRNGNASANVGDFNNGLRFEFLFLGGDAGYTYNDNGGLHSTGIGFTSTGLRLGFTLTGANTYSLSVSNLASGVVSLVSGTLAGSGSVDSFSIFNNNAGGGGAADAFFNSFEVNAVPEPSTVMLWATGVATLYYGRRRNRQANARA